MTITIGANFKTMFKFILFIVTCIFPMYVMADLSNPANNTTYGVHYHNQVIQLINQVNINNLWNNLKNLTSFPNRDASSYNGFKIANWVTAQVDSMIKESGRNDITVYTIKTPNHDGYSRIYNYATGKYDSFAEYQPSIVVQIGHSALPGVVIGAHMDTLGSDDEYTINSRDYGSTATFPVNIHKILLLSNNDKPEADETSIFLQKNGDSITAFWAVQILNKDNLNTDTQIVSKRFEKKDLHILGLEKIISLFPANDAAPYEITQKNNKEMMDKITSLCGFTLQPEGGVFPGADDDGSGVVALLETAGILITSNMQFNKPIYLIWYGAEEEGLLGSKEVVDDFKNKNIPIDAIMQLDQIGYVNNNDPTIYLDIDKTDSALTDYLKMLAEQYISQPVQFTHGGGGSDHESWLFAGYKRIVRPAEDYSHSPSNPFMHSSEDTMDKLSLNHMIDYVKLTIAFTVELAEPVA